MINVAIFGWPVIATVIFSRIQSRAAIVIAILAAYLLLPGRGGIDLPALPAIDKSFLTSFLPLLLAVAMLPQQRSMDLPGLFPRSATVLILATVLIGGMIATALNNGTPIRFPDRLLRGLTLYDGLSDVLDAIIYLAPLLLGRKYFGHPDSHALLLKIVVFAGTCYTFLALYEIRMSPQLNIMIYGYFPHSFIQHLRAGGWRPIVFLPHGLFVSLFFAMAFLAALVLWIQQRGEKNRSKYLFVVLWLFGTLVLCKSLGAIILGVIGGAVLLFFTARLQVLFAAIICGIVLTYPTLRAVDLVPTDVLLEKAAQIDPARAKSLGQRFRSEDLFLAKAREKPLLGWGKNGRSRAHNEQGRDQAIPDGIWVIQLGIGGWFRYVGLFGLLTYGVIALATKRWPVSRATAGLTMLLAINLVDLLPNSGLTPLTWLISGAIIGRLEWGRLDKDDTPDDSESAEEEPKRLSPYSRQTKMHKRPRPTGRRASFAR